MLRDARWDRQHKQFMRELATRYSTKVTLALVESFDSPDVAARLLRFPGGRPPENVIVLERTSLTPERLMHTLTALSESRLQDGELPGKRVSLVFADGSPTKPITPDEKTYASRMIAELLAAEPSTLPEVGTVPAVTIEVGPVKE